MKARLPRKINDDALRKLWVSALPDKELAARLGHGRGVLRRRAYKLGMPPRKIIWSQYV